MRTLRILTCAGLLLLTTTACSKKPKQTEASAATASAVDESAGAGVALAFQPDAIQKGALVELLKKLNRENWRFPSKDTNAPENARLFTYLAATSTDPVVVGAALSAMHGAYSSHSKRKVQPDQDFVAVVKKHLASEDPKIITRALLAARTAIAGKEASAELIAATVALAGRYPSGPGRYALIDALRVVSNEQRDRSVMKIFEESLDAKEPYVVSYALQALYRATRSIEDKEGIRTKVLALAKHADPGVRGRAIELLGALGKDDPVILELVLAALSDPHPYVRSEACESIARLRHKPAIHRLIALVDDQENNRYDLRDWTTLEGKPGRLHHDGSPWSHVFDAAMSAIRSLSGGELSLERINPKEIDKGLAANAAATRAWYARAKSSIPTTATAGDTSEAAKPTPAATAPKPRVTLPSRPAPSGDTPAGATP